MGVLPLPQMMQLTSVGLDEAWLYSAPPAKDPEFPLKVQLVSVGLEEELYIPPPAVDARFPLNVQLLRIA